MKLKSAARLLQFLPTRAECALTTRQIREEWARAGTEPIELRTVQRYMSELSADGADGPALVDVVEDRAERRYFLRLSQVSQWFMTEEAALSLLWSRQALARSFAAIYTEQMVCDEDLAHRVTAGDGRTRRLRERLRLVPDGIGRLPARVGRDVLVSVVDAIGAGQLVSFDYVSAGGKASTKTRSPQGLVAKDGSLYLLATEGLSDPPITFALHRMARASVLPRPMTHRADFDLDRYIEDTHQLSHRLQADAPPLQLKLRVSPEDVFHFKERPLAASQQISLPDVKDGWCVVTAEVPDTVQLLPFLVSFCGVEVLAPPDLRQRVGRWLHEAAARYGNRDADAAKASTPGLPVAHASDVGITRSSVQRQDRRGSNSCVQPAPSQSSP